MKDRLRYFLYPMNLWSRFVIYYGWLIKFFDKWLLKPLIDKLLSINSEVIEDKDRYSTGHVCVQCGRMVRLALVTNWDNRIKFFCGTECRNSWGHSSVFEEDFEDIKQPSM